MADLIRISAVSYLNTQPFVYGLKHSGIELPAALSLDMPADCARKLMSGEADLGLVPVAILPQLSEYHIASKFGIAADGPVNSVMLYSEVPVDQIEEVLLDYQSRTSVTLVRVLAQELWKISPRWIPASEGFEQKISGTRAGVVIGDRTFSMNGKFPYTYDLSENWKTLTGLPFIFACWTSTKKLPDSFTAALDEALAYGVAHIPEMVRTLPETEQANALTYLTKYIQFPLTEEMHQARILFFEKMKALKPL